MSNLLMLLIAAGGTSLCACSAQPQVREPNVRPAIVVRQPKGEPGDFNLCKDGRALVFAAGHPKMCS
jgi:hypothetical protein